MNHYPYRFFYDSFGLRCFFRIAAFSALSAFAPLMAQTVDEQSSEQENDIIELSPFQVSSTSDQGYAARETLAGSRVKTELKDVPAQISVMTKEFLDDIAAVAIDDAYRYSVNVENTTEYQSATIGGGDFNSGVVNIFNNNRVRGLTAPGRTHDFFLTNTPGDTYNSERVTFSSGPNSILFGNGNPAGIIDNSFKQVRLDRSRYQLSFRNDDNGSMRASFDANQAIAPDKFGVRVAGVAANNHEPRDPAGEKIKRVYGTLTFKPFPSTSVRAYYEDAHSERTVARNTLVGDLVTPWIAAGRPLFNNGLTNTQAVPGANDPVFEQNRLFQNVLLFGATDSGVFMPWGGGATVTPTSNYSVLTKGPGSRPYQTGVNSYTYSLTDPSISPRDISINGPETTNTVDSTIKGLIVEQRIGQDLFIEFGYNKEDLTNPVTDYLRGIQSAIRADANMYLPDRVTPNPNVGKYYVEGNGRARLWRSDSEEMRVMASYELDLRNVSKWLGHHRFAALYQRVDQVSAGQEFAARVVPAGTSFDDALNNYGSGTYNTLMYRAYLSDPTDSSTGSTFYFDAPGDPGAPLVLPDGSTAYTLDNPYGATGSANLTHTLLEGKLFAMNNYLFDDRLVTSFGWRNDHVRGADNNTARLGNGGSKAAWQSIANMEASDDWNSYTEGNTFTGGAVLHLFPWVSVFYNQSSTWNPPRIASHNPDDSVIDGSIGDGSDYGIMLRFFDNRLSLRLNKYENTSGPDISSFRTSIIPQILDIEETIFDAAEAGLIGSYPSAGAFDPQTSNDYYYDVTSNQVSKGYEFEVVYNPTRNWRIAINGAKAEASESDIALPWVKFVDDRIAVWRQYPDLIGPTSEGKTDSIRTRVVSLVQTLDVIKQSEGQRTEQQRDWRVNFLTRYSFSEGALKGAFVGAGYRWRSRAAIGYRAITVDTAYPFPGVPDQLTVPSVESPIYGSGYGDTELFFGYSRKLGKKVTWKVQLNIRNVLDDDGLLGQRANTDGDVTVYTVPQPRRFILTNTFEF